MPAGPAGKIFISYRRQETAWPARQLYEVLVARFGAESVFKDVDDIEPGDDFVDRINDAVGACDVLLALIGPQWISMTDDKGRRRLDNPDDFVRIELTAALSRGVRVVPILVDGARMPEAEQLPADLAPLVRRQAVEINPVGFNTDRLLATVSATLARPRATEEPPPVPPPPPPDPVPVDPGPTPTPTPAPAPTPGPGPGTDGRSKILLGAGALVAVLVVVAVVWQPWREQAGAGVRQPAASSSSGVPTTTPATSPPTTSPTTTTTTNVPSPATAELPDPPIVAHRGGLEEHQFETQAAMEAAARSGFAIETDVRYTRDGVAVLVHDEKATRGLDCGGRDIRVSKVSWSQLRAACRTKPTSVDPTSYQVPRLEATLEAIAAASPTAWVILEVKTDLSAARLRELLATPAEFGLTDRTVFSSFARPRLREIRTADADTRRMLLVSGEQIPAAELKADRLWGVAVEQGIADRDYVQALQAVGLRVMVWVVNDPKQWERADGMAPDLVMTGYPAKYQAWLAGR